MVIPTPILLEVSSLSEHDAAELGLVLLEPTMGQLTEATASRSDRALFDACRATGITVWRGLRPLISLVEAQVITVKASIAIVRSIRKANGYITESVMRAYVHEIRVISRRMRRGSTVR